MTDNEMDAGTAKPPRTARAFGDPAPLSVPNPIEAAPPAAPRIPTAMERAARERDAQLNHQEGTERRSTLRGLMLLALAVMVFSLIRAGAERAFPAGWWR